MYCVNFLQLAAIGAMNRELNMEHTLTHFSQNTKKIELNQIVNFGICNNLLENIYLLFPEKYKHLKLYMIYLLNINHLMTNIIL